MKKTKNFKLLSKLARKSILEDQRNQLKNHLKSNFKNPKALWQTAKDNLYGKQNNFT